MRKICLLTIALLTITFVIHYSLILMHAAPTNPISAKYNNLSSTYTSTIFSQNWHLFAPDPINRNVHIYIQVTDDTSKDTNNHWIDMTRHFIKNNNDKVITPYNRTIRLIDGIFADTVGSNYTSDLITKYVNKNDEDDDPVVDMLTEHKKSSQEKGEYSLYRLASSYIRSFMSDKYISMKYLRVRLTVYETVPFSKRNDKNYERKIEYNKTFNWKEISEVSQMY
ncbi:hypothetical protein SAMN05421807_1274 [Virgibacillus chiguensis]|uniref:Uncharacterized protein n=2 Tax=Virgibacillus chiguensis TaxID=411959 RepID=A0A1M5XH88_9BACI|nr:hypothetical protein SAMN05421807_1274 [Virgibacillus chiguensis]